MGSDLRRHLRQIKGMTGFIDDLATANTAVSLVRSTCVSAKYRHGPKRRVAHHVSELGGNAITRGASLE